MGKKNIYTLEKVYKEGDMDLDALDQLISLYQEKLFELYQLQGEGFHVSRLIEEYEEKLREACQILCSEGRTHSGCNNN